MIKYPYTVFLLLVLGVFTSKGQSHFSAKNLEIIQQVGETIKNNHIDYKLVEPLVAPRFCALLLQHLDPLSLYLTRRDTANINLIFNNSDFDMQSDYFRSRLEELRALYHDKLLTSDKLLQQLPSLDFFERDVIQLSLMSADNSFWAEDETVLAQGWQRRIKLNVLYRYHADSVLEGTSSSVINKQLNERVAYEIKSERCKIASLLEEEENLSQFILNSCLKAYCESFDPHSTYLTKEDEINFMNSLSSEYYGTGITYIRRGNQYQVGQVSPFSSASDHEEIRKGDEITSIIVDGEPINLSCISQEKLDGYFYGDEGESLHLELRSSQDQKFRQFELVKSWVNNNENHTYSFLLQDSTTKVGYMSFPAFYAPMTLSARSSAEDMALILMELQKHSPDGLIIDLRNNGGGSLEEAQDLIGYFTDFGPLFTAVTKEKPEGQLIKDSKRGSLTSAKMVFLVNGLSASASELVVAAMQFYPNSLIVGSPTFGKATGQRIFPLQALYDETSLGSVIVTNLKAYRIDGSNHQGDGVLPDIVLPSLFTKTLVSETLLPYPLTHENSARKFSPISKRQVPLNSLRDQVKQRNSLAVIDSLSQSLNQFLQDSSGVSLHFDSFRNVFSEVLDYPFETSDTFEMTPLEVNEAFLKESKRISNLKSKDPILVETFRIVKDWVMLTNQP